ncbi:S41 family peptidase [Tepidibacillus infernus]|uniref:S41 family peptidase n=1 Tax=Tepidibacillus TaxID=1494427 RepID=UPI0008537D60|nr:S41 family peptidase [Tepidibacillus sp. HK-1]GBF10593.1 carboxy-terminal processing protease CtpB precursor [Tepidibacillus sp. HK-1]
MVKGRTLLILLVLSIVLSSLVTAMVVDGNGIVINQPSGTESVPKEMNKLVDVYQTILQSYVEKKNGNELIDGAIRGMVQSLNDPHSTYMDAKESKDFFGSLNDSFEGIGTEVTIENGKITVIAPIKGSPSEKAGIRPRDQIIKVNGESLEGLNLIEAVSKIRGPKGTKAVLEIVRPGIEAPIEITVIRDEIPIETVYSSTISSKKGTLGKIEITNFGENTAAEFKKALKDLESKGIKGLIIDVRGNPGGYLQSVLEIGNLVVPNKGIIVQVEDRNKKREQYHSEMEQPSYPIVSLINGGSASAAEILVAALQEAGHYPVVGEPSFGKGTVQNPFELSDGSNVKLTVAKWLTPNGNWIHQKGIQPDVKMEQPEYFHAAPFPEDIQLKRDTNSNDVKNLQIILNGLGYKTGRTDGYFDQETVLAVQAFQKANGLNASGVVDQVTANKLQDKIIERIRDPKNDLQLQVAIETLLKAIK